MAHASYDSAIIQLLVCAVPAFIIQGITVEALDGTSARIALLTLSPWLAFRFGQVYQRTP